MDNRVFAVSILLLAVTGGGAFAQAPDPGSIDMLTPGAAQTEPLNSSAADREARLDRLFDRLAGAKDAQDAKRYESTIETLWQQSGSDTADLFATRAAELVSGEDADGALRMLDAALDAKPDYAEGWNKRATLFFLRGDYVRAMRDIRETLRFEPRHYGAWAGLGRILEQSGDNRRALDAYRRALAIHPKLDGLQDQIKELTTKVRGQEL